MTDPMHQLLDKMQNLMGKHRDAPVMHEHETEPASLPSTDDVSEATPFPVLTDIVRRGEIIADAPSPTTQPAPDFADEGSTHLTEEMVYIPESFTPLEQTDPYPVDTPPVLTDIVWRSEDPLPSVATDATQTAPDIIEDSTVAIETAHPDTHDFPPPEGLPADVADSPEENPHFTAPAIDIASPLPLVDVPSTPVEITHLTAPIEDHPRPFTSPEQAELLATSVATHVLGMIDGYLMHEVNTVVAQRLRRVVDDALSTLLTQLALDMESLVREAVVEELARHGIRPANPTEKPSNPV
ncbi:MAG: hypothetical protein ACYCY1_10485 [Sulfuriferula sp.]